jgi:FAD/FMN-containing dehydrogenase
MLPLLSCGFAKAAATMAKQRVRPVDRLWPGAASWAKLKADVGGNLTEVRPLFGSCEAASSGAACLDAIKGVGNPYWIGDQPAGTQVSGWLDAWTPAPSAYALKARNAADVAAGVNFARENNLMLAVKGGGHSYQGTSSAPDSLLIWTRAMNKVTLHDGFVGKNCESHAQPVPAVSAEAGAMWMDLYNAVTTHGGRYVQGGGCMTVGVAGLVQSGGFGVFSKGFGTAAAGLLEAEIVTADGRVRVANACTNPDLFWAIKGGGGGTFGVVTRLTLRTHELPGFFGFVGGTIKAQSDLAFARLVARFVAFYDENLFNSQWGEQVKLGPDNTLEISMLSMGLDAGQIESTWKPFADWINASPEDFTWASALRSAARDPRTWWAIDGNRNMERDTRSGVPQDHAWSRADQGEVGAFLHGYDSVWLPASLLQKDRQKQLADALFAASRHKLVRLFMNKGLAGAPAAVLAAERRTAMNPKAIEAFALAIIADGQGPAYPGLARAPFDPAAARKDAHEIDLATAELRNIVPDAGSYVSESNYFNRAWQNAFWGENYPRLRTVKAKYDPDGLFFVHHGVGSEDWSEDGFTRVA